MDRLNQANCIGTGIKSVAALSAWKIPLISQRTWGPLVHMDSGAALMLRSGPIIKTPLRQPPLAIYTKRMQLHNCTIKADAQHFSEEDEISHSSVGALRSLQHGRVPLLSKQWRGVTTLQCGQASWRVAQQSWFVNTASCFLPVSLCDLPWSGFENGTEVRPDRCCHVRKRKELQDVFYKVNVFDRGAFSWFPPGEELLALGLV